MRIGVPTATRCQMASISAFVTAMQPAVQSARRWKRSPGDSLSPVAPFRVVNIGNGGSWNMVAAPFANGGAEIGEGEFNASATIVAAFQ